MKTVYQALRLAKVIEKEVNNLPDQNFLGDSNLPEKEKSRDWIFALREYAQNGTIPDTIEMVEVKYWITGEGWSALEDYEVGE